MAAPADELVPFAEAPALFEAVAGRRPPLPTVTHWRRDGLIVGGDRVYLRATKFGGRWFVSRSAVEQFLAATSGDPAPQIVAPAKRKAASEAGVDRVKKLLATL